MISPVREECGLGFPPQTFTTNASESINAMLKNKVNYQRSELPIFVDKVKELIAEQAREAERAVVNQGKYRFRSQYRFLEVPEARWFVMNQEQHAKHLSKVQSLSFSMSAPSFPSHCLVYDCSYWLPSLLLK